MNVISRNHDGSKVVMGGNVLFFLLVIPFGMLFLNNIIHLVVEGVVKMIVEFTIKFWINFSDAFVQNQIASEIN